MTRSEAMNLGAVAPQAHDHINILPGHMHASVSLWILHGIQPGHFLTAIIHNDFAEAACRADTDNAASLREWAEFFYNFAPPACWGSPTRAKEWKKRGGLLGQQEAAA